jgi:SAM-dependent methyltransferase
VIAKVRDWLIDPTVRSLDVDSLEFSLAHRRVVQRKIILRSLFESFYKQCRAMDLRHIKNCPGARLEIGSGAGIISEIYPDMITSDVKVLPFIDLVLSASNLPFADNSLRAIYAINVFHHLPSPRDFLREALRVLYPGGGVVLIEPFYGPVASCIFKNLHKSERFDPSVAGWESSDEMGSFSNANQALSYVIFKRDRVQFDREFPQFELVLDRPHTHLWYLVSGGVNFRQLLPDSLTFLVKATERLLSPLNRWLALQHTIVLRKKPASG